jgi:transcriptional regulator with PAS, ATPase and Fis domain
VFISVDLGAIAESLFESELFGHVKGSFTDAKQDKAGRFEIASGGTLFLDEIGNLSLALQSKLLTVLQNRKVQRVGSSRDIPVDFRLICATNMPLNEMTVEKKFRQDLLYRINTVEIRVPPLRERAEDILALANYFLRMYGNKYKRPGMKISNGVMTRLKRYQWPGNIRELQHAVERAVILTDGTVIENVDLLIGGTTTDTLPGKKALTMDDMEKEFIIQSLRDHDGHVSNTAKTLGMTRTALYRRMNKYGIVKP